MNPDPFITQDTANPIGIASATTAGVSSGASGTSRSASVPVDTVNRDFRERAMMQQAQTMGLSYVNLSEIIIPPDLLRLITWDEAKTAQMIPFYRIGKKMRLAVAHPTLAKTLETIKAFKAEGYAINISLCSEDSIQDVLRRQADFKESTPIKDQNFLNTEEAIHYQAQLQSLANLQARMATITAEEALTLIHQTAYYAKASDVHYQPYENHVLLRFRIDGVLQEVLRLEPKTYLYIVNQLKYLCGMKLNIDTIPQDGRYFMEVHEKKLDLRVSSIPTAYGESFVCRLLDSTHKALDFKDLGYMPYHLNLIHASLALNTGMILSTGPTGSGKTTTLYSYLNIFNEPHHKIITLEDPIEYQLEGITQSQINPKREYTFASGLRAILRQDPDIVMIGEIRDNETAVTAAQAALTGHLLLSTLHANSALETVARLRNIGLPSYMIAPSLALLMSQRLVRRVCPHCQESVPMDTANMQRLDSWLKMFQAQQAQDPFIQSLKLPVSSPRGQGCDHCHQTGYLGQMVLAEILPVDDELRTMILEEKAPADIKAHLFKKGFITMKDDAMIKVVLGQTSLEEVDRVLGL